MPNLEELEAELRTGMKLSRQSSYSRRAPDSAALPHLHRAQVGLQELTEIEPTNAKGWELLSRAEECLLNYDQAIGCMERCMELVGAATKSQRKRLAMLRQADAEWNQSTLTPDQLKRLRSYLESVDADKTFQKRSLEFTENWLRNEGFSDPESIIDELKVRGAFSDFQVYHNVILG